MNFKFILILILAYGCGVKGNPTPPVDAYTPSFIENYPDIKVNQPIDDSKNR